MDTAEIESHLAELRRAYVEASPEQRLGVAMQRIRNPHHDPNLLIAYVSAVEGFARSLCVHQRGQTIEQLSAAYKDFEKRGPQSLVGEYLAAKALPPPREHFGSDTWKLFGYAVEYRNLLAHECTYLGQDRSPELIDACRKVLQTLATNAGLSAEYI